MSHALLMRKEKKLQKKGIAHKIDHILVSANNRKLVEDCQEENPSTTFRNHQSSIVMMRLRSPKKTSKPKNKINCHEFINSDNKDDFNRKLKYILANFVDLCYDEFKKYIKLAAEDSEF